MSVLSEAAIREIVTEVVSRLGGDGVPGVRAANRPTGFRGRFGVFHGVDEACTAAHEAYRQLQEQGVAARVKVVEIVKRLVEINAEAWGRLELDETKIGRLDHKIEKLQIVKLVPGVEWLHPYALSGDHGITHEEYTPFGVIGAVTPSTHSVPTLSGNIVNIVAAGNAVVFNAHPAAARCAITAVRGYNEAIYRETGIENIACIIDPPTLESFDALCRHELVKLLLVTGRSGRRQGGHAGRQARDLRGAWQSARPGGRHRVPHADGPEGDPGRRLRQQPAVHRRETAVRGRDDRRRADDGTRPSRRGAPFRLPSSTRSRARHSRSRLARAAGAATRRSRRISSGRTRPSSREPPASQVPSGTQLLFAETDASHPFVREEQMMPFLPIVRVRSVEEGIERAFESELGYKHTSMIHSTNVEHMTSMARRLDTTLFIKNGPCMAGLGLGGEGYLSYSIATPTGEGVTNPKTFCRVRRCVMVDNLRIY